MNHIQESADATVPTQPQGFSKQPSQTAARLTQLKAENKPAMIGYLPFGFPDTATSIEAMRTLVENGCDIVEIGLPYSDPVMDGPVIQRASQIAIENGERIANVFKAVEAVAEAGGVPLIMSYWNLIFHYGVEQFARDFAQAGGAGLITPDLIPDEAGEWIEASDRYGLDRIFLVSPDSTDRRLKVVTQHARGFVYAASRMGVTGERDALDIAPQTLVRRTHEAGAEFVCVGIGVSNAEQARTVGAYADGVIVGSALVHTLLDEDGNAKTDTKAALQDLATVTRTIAQGVHTARQ
ncbi:tryptophan synthase subunit alpha [Bifidobacterium dolichotidis]|uniref:Tryptophan synthase alpha chain n=1 Tax=Bifidobacterium dolichotidis TaxID=2306976 RepID=A0A430FTD4_9BIFI|nr:tryptophan synthase subunit alpha [Bifidobacterium dolichotidis]RSX56075.1 tryptophan synthase subunit alpha [Bifidobacterium dolichotidis]